MAKAEFYQRGENLDFTNTTTSKIEWGTVMQIGDKVAVAAGDIEPGKLGAVATEGVYKMQKATATDAIEAGKTVYVNAEGKVLKATASGAIQAGYAAYASAANDPIVAVKINA